MAIYRKERTMTTPLSTTAGADLPTPFGRGGESLKDSFWYTGWLLTFLATGDQTQGRFALIDALTRKGNCPPRQIHHSEDESLIAVASNYGIKNAPPKP
jgi:hypothetical protein